MAIIGMLISIVGGLCLFLYGMQVMSEGIQRAAGNRMQKVLNFMTGNRFIGVMTGFAVTAIIQSSSAATVMVVSFVNAGLLTLTQSIGVIMGANIGTTVTAWIVSLVGFSLKISTLALPAVGLGFVMRIIKWKYKTIGEAIMGFGLLFLGLDFLAKAMPSLNGNEIGFIARVSDLGFVSILIGAGAGIVMTLITHSSSASTAIMLTMAFNGVAGYEMTAAMVLGANIGTTIDAALAGIGARTAAKRTALVHVLFNVIGVCWAIPLIKPLLALVELVTPGTITAGLVRDPMITTHLAMLHTVFNVVNAIIFFPFVKPFASLVSFLIKDTDSEKKDEHYRLVYRGGGAIQDAPELAVIQAGKEMRDMAAVAYSMYDRVSKAFYELKDVEDREVWVEKLMQQLSKQEAYVDEMREQLTAFLIECNRHQLGPGSEQNVSRLLRIVADLEYITDDCYSIACILERSAKKDLIFKEKEMILLSPYIALVEEFLSFVHSHLGSRLHSDEAAQAEDFEARIDKLRNKLRKRGRKRIEAGEDVKTELLFIDLVRRLENLGDYCYAISHALSHMA
ncbi:MAG: Na/Pi cotransporter family protein [Treponema sp.]|jgi:phosphate:Na+ symporter|nr:Na/Pi cotransporter family protein [Treponema sp.]